MYRLAALAAMLLALVACTNPDDLDEEPSYLGNFRLGHNVVVAPNLTKGPVSREASEEEWVEAMKTTIQDRFGRYEGDKLYHLGISIEGYVLARPGVPVVASPKSVLILQATVWDDAAGSKLNDKPEQVTVMESFSGNTIIGSGLTQSREKQMENLSRNAAKQIENWLVRENSRKGWFEDGDISDAAKAAEERIEEEDAQPIPDLDTSLDGLDDTARADTAAENGPEPDGE